MISFSLTEEQELIRDTVREFAQSEMREIARECDESRAVPDDFLNATWELGLANSAIPDAYGGADLPRSPITNALVLEELGWGDVPLAAAALAPAAFVQALIDFGTDEQKREYLPLFAGTTFQAASLALHEGQFSYDPANLRTVAEPKGSGFRISGLKRFVLLGDRASHFLVVTRNGGEGLDGLDAFIVPRDAQGLTIGADERQLGFQATPTATLELDGVEVPEAARLGGETGIDGARLVSSARAGSAALGVGLARGVLELSVPYAKERIAFGQPIAQKQAIAFMLAQMQVELNSMRHLVWKAASELEHGRSAVREATLAQVYTSREVMRSADNGVQIYGGHGYIREYPVEMWYRNARALTIVDGAAAL